MIKSSSGRKQKCMSTQIQCCVWESYIIIQKRKGNGEIRLVNFNVPRQDFVSGCLQSRDFEEMVPDVHGTFCSWSMPSRTPSLTFCVCPSLLFWQAGLLSLTLAPRLLLEGALGQCARPRQHRILASAVHVFRVLASLCRRWRARIVACHAIVR